MKLTVHHISTKHLLGKKNSGQAPKGARIKITIASLKKLTVIHNHDKQPCLILLGRFQRRGSVTGVQEWNEGGFQLLGPARNSHRRWSQN